MSKVMKTCRVCGRSYEACRTVSNALGVFRWQEVACSPECGSVYLQKLNESRGVHTEQPKRAVPNVPADQMTAEPAKSSARKKKAHDTGPVPGRVEAGGDSTDVVQ